jgi:hypothetical protein
VPARSIANGFYLPAAASVMPAPSSDEDIFTTGRPPDVIIRNSTVSG